MTAIGTLHVPGHEPLAVHHPSGDQLRRALEIAIDQGNRAHAELFRRMLWARGEDVPEPRELQAEAA